MRDIDTPRALRLAQRAPHAPSAPVALGWAAAPERSRACSSTRIARQGKRRWETCCKVAHVCRMREIPRSRTTPRRLKRFSSVLMNSAPLRRLRAGTRGSAPSGGYHDAPGAWNPPSRAAADPRSSSMQHSRGSPVGKHADSGVAQNILGVCISPEVCLAAQGQSGQSAPSWRAARSHGPPQARHARMCRPCGGPRRLGAGTRRALPPLLWTRRGLQCLTPCPPLARAQTAEESLAQHILLAASKMAPAEGAHEGRYERSERADKRGAGSRKGHEESSPPPSPERESWGRKKALPRVTKTRTRAHMRRPRRRVAAAALRSLFLPETPAVTALGEAPRRHASTMQGRTSRGQGHHANPKMRHFGAG